MIRLGGPVFGNVGDPDRWARAHRDAGYTAAYCPVGPDADDHTLTAYDTAARNADLTIAEVGAWSNPLSSDPQARSDALDHCIRQLALAERIGARCCVNIAGSRGAKWDGPDARDLTSETFDMIVETVRKIVDAVGPVRTHYTLEPMPWMYPDSADSYLALIRAVDRPGFGVHLDPVNMVCSPQRYFANGDLIRDCVERLGPHIKSCHAKDIVLSPNLTTHLDEVRPGLGALDYRTFLEALDRLIFDVPLMLEHMTAEEDYVAGAEYIRSVAKASGVELRA
jgi:sugar phosphate isomerase/epimerase